MAEAKRQFATDRPLLYNVPPWNELGFAVPNFADSPITLNTIIHGLADEIGQCQLNIMIHVDAMRKQPPSINTIRRLGGMFNRIKTVLENRKKADNELRLEGIHASPAPKAWNIHPVPYFTSKIVRNKWLQEYNEYCMFGLINMYQHSDNNIPLTITEKFATDVFAYFNELKLRMGTELLKLPLTALKDPTFEFTEASYAAYNPSVLVSNLEATDNAGPIGSLPTADLDLRLLRDGIPATLIVEHLAQYAVGNIPGMTGMSGEALSTENKAPGTADGKGIGPPVV